MKNKSTRWTPEQVSDCLTPDFKLSPLTSVKDPDPKDVDIIAIEPVGRQLPPHWYLSLDNGSITVNLKLIWDSETEEPFDDVEALESAELAVDEWLRDDWEKAGFTFQDSSEWDCLRMETKDTENGLEREYMVYAQKTCHSLEDLATTCKWLAKAYFITTV